MNSIEAKVLFQPKQWKAFQMLEDTRVLGYGGGKGGGKSFLIRGWQLHRRTKFPYTRGLIIRRTYPELYENHVLKFFEEYPWTQQIYNKGEKMFYLPNGSTLKMGFILRPDDVFQFQGREFEDIAVDEGQQHSEQVFKILRTSNRTTHKDINPRMLVTFNPGGLGHRYLKRIFIEKKFLPKEKPGDYAFLQALIRDNPALIDADPEYLQTLEELPEEWRRAYLEGDWNVFIGQVFTEWRDPIHVVKQFEYPIAQCHKVIGFDWGYNDFGCAVFAGWTLDKHLQVYREVYKNQTTPRAWAEEVAIWCKIDKDITEIILPHDCFNKGVEGHRASVADIFRETFNEMGVNISITRADTLSHNARLTRVLLLHQYLSEAPDGLPWIQFHERCENCISTIPNLAYAKSQQQSPEDVDTLAEDHAYDAVTIILLSRHGDGKGSGPVTPTKDTPKKSYWDTTSGGDIKAPDFWEAIKDQSIKPKRSWEVR